MEQTLEKKASAAGRALNKLWVEKKRKEGTMGAHAKMMVEARIKKYKQNRIKE